MRTLKRLCARTGIQPFLGYSDSAVDWAKESRATRVSLMLMQLVEPYSPPAQEPVRLRLARWQREVPLYRDLYRGVAGRANSDGLEWARLPFVTRREMRLNFPQNFLGDGVELSTLIDRSEVELEHTSGTSGERQPLLLAVGWWAEQEFRALQLNRLVARELDSHPFARRAILASPSCGGGLCNQGQTTARERTDEMTLLLSTSRQPWLWSEQEWDRVAREILEWAPLFLDTDPVYAAALARHCLRRGVRFPSVRFVLSSYEFVSAVHRKVIERAFDVPVFNLYGATETGHLLMEDETGKLRASTETAWLELIQTDDHGIGELVVTTTTNEYMPLIRYRIGDLVRCDTDSGGMSWELHGRVRDTLTNAQGYRITTRQVDDCLAEVDGILHYQCVQDRSGKVNLRYIPDDPPPTNEGLANAIEKLKTLLGRGSDLRVRPASILLGEPSGKFRLTRRTEE